MNNHKWGIVLDILWYPFLFAVVGILSYYFGTSVGIAAGLGLVFVKFVH
jgi:hypothetical protein